MADLVEKFDTFKKNLASEKRRRVTNRRDKIIQIAKDSINEIHGGSTEKYREGWERIFAKKPDTTQNESTT